jgi:hypothetical protein
VGFCFKTFGKAIEFSTCKSSEQHTVKRAILVHLPLYFALYFGQVPPESQTSLPLCHEQPHCATPVSLIVPPPPPLPRQQQHRHAMPIMHKK